MFFGHKNHDIVGAPWSPNTMEKQLDAVHVLLLVLRKSTFTTESATVTVSGE